MLPVLELGSQDSRVTTHCVQLDVFNSTVSDSATTVHIDKGVDVSEKIHGAPPVTTSDMADTLVYEVVDVLGEL